MPCHSVLDFISNNFFENLQLQTDPLDEYENDAGKAQWHVCIT